MTNLNGALDKFPELKSLGLAELNKAVGTDAIPKDIATVVRNNGGGHWNHSFFWKVSNTGTAISLSLWLTNRMAAWPMRQKIP